MLFLSGIAESKGMLVGCNQGVMSVDFDSNCTHIICASNDFASRVWTVADQRLRVSKASFCVMLCLWICSVFCLKFSIQLKYNIKDAFIKNVVFCTMFLHYILFTLESPNTRFKVFKISICEYFCLSRPIK